MNEFLQSTDVIDWKHPDVLARARFLAGDCDQVPTIVRRCFEWVRDEIKHSHDHGLQPVTCCASEVLKVGSGIAGMLMDRGLEHARHLEASQLWLCVWNQNSRAIAFYQRWGFAPVVETSFCWSGVVFHDQIMTRRVQAGSLREMESVGDGRAAAEFREKHLAGTERSPLNPSRGIGL